MSEKEQSVVEDAEDQLEEAGPEAGDAQEKDTLDNVLSEYEESEKKPEPKDEQKTEQPDEVREYIRRQQAREVREDIDSAVKTVVGDSDMNDRVVRALLNDEAQQNPRFLKAWNERHDNPKGWGRVLKAFRSDIDKMFEPKVDQAVTEDVAAVRQAVRGASTKAPDPDEVPDFRGKSDAEFEDWLRKQKKAS